MVFDASGIWGFGEREVSMVPEILSYFEKTNHKMIMCSENFIECPYNLRTILRESSAIEEVKVSQDSVSKVKGGCRQKVGPNDYKCIATAVQFQADFLVTNDFGLVKAANEFRKGGGGSYAILTPVSLLFYMYRLHRELFDWKPSLIGAMKFYHHVEINRTVLGITKMQFTEEDAKQIFAPYANHVYDTLKTV